MTLNQALFKRKVDLGEYGDALTWARAYGFCADGVRQAQWRESEVSRVAISDYLSKVA